jgi:hypothetical protein
MGKPYNRSITTYPPVYSRGDPLQNLPILRIPPTTPIYASTSHTAYTKIFVYFCETIQYWIIIKHRTRILGLYLSTSLSEQTWGNQT